MYINIHRDYTITIDESSLDAGPIVLTINDGYGVADLFLNRDQLTEFVDRIKEWLDNDQL